MSCYKAVLKASEEASLAWQNLGICYQELGELFEKTSIVAEGGAMEVGRVIPGALDKLELTPELVNRAAYIADDCDAEIIRFNRP